MRFCFGRPRHVVFVCPTGVGNWGEEIPTGAHSPGASDVRTGLLSYGTRSGLHTAELQGNSLSAKDAT